MLSAIRSNLLRAGASLDAVAVEGRFSGAQGATHHRIGQYHDET